MPYIKKLLGQVAGSQKSCALYKKLLGLRVDVGVFIPVPLLYSPIPPPVRAAGPGRATVEEAVPGKAAVQKGVSSAAWSILVKINPFDGAF